MLATAARLASSRSRAVCVRAFIGDEAPKVPRSSTPRRRVAAAAPATPAKAPAKAEKPKALRAPSAFNLYTKQEFAAVQTELKSKATDGQKVLLPAVNAVLRERWNALDAAGKAPFETAASARKAEVDAKKAELLAEKKANAKPLSAYMLFANKRRPSLLAANPGMKITQAASELGKLWKAMSPEEQKPFRDEYELAHAAWKAKQDPSA